MALVILEIITYLFKNSSENADKMQKKNEINYSGYHKILKEDFEYVPRGHGLFSILFSVQLQNNCIPLSYFQYDYNKKIIR